MSPADQLAVGRHWLEHAVDLHVHCAPSFFPRWGDGLDVARSCEHAGMAGILLTAHEGSTVEPDMRQVGLDDMHARRPPDRHHVRSDLLFVLGIVSFLANPVGGGVGEHELNAGDDRGLATEAWPAVPLDWEGAEVSHFCCP